MKFVLSFLLTLLISNQLSSHPQPSGTTGGVVKGVMRIVDLSEAPTCVKSLQDFILITGDYQHICKGGEWTSIVVDKDSDGIVNSLDENDNLASDKGDSDLFPANVRRGFNILGVDGTYSAAKTLEDEVTITDPLRFLAPDSKFHYSGRFVTLATPDVISSMAYSPNPPRIVASNAGSRHKAIYFYELNGNPKLDETFDTNPLKRVTGIAINDKKVYVSYYNTKEIEVYDIKGNRFENLDFELDRLNSSPADMTSTDSRLYVLNSGHSVRVKKIFVYGFDGTRYQTDDITLHSDNSHPSTIEHFNNKIYVVDHVDRKAYVYNFDKSRDSSSDFNLNSRNRNPSGFASAPSHCFIADSNKDSIYAYGGQGAFSSSRSFNSDSRDLEIVNYYFDKSKLYILSTQKDSIYLYDRYGKSLIRSFEIAKGNLDITATDRRIYVSYEGSLIPGTHHNYFKHIYVYDLEGTPKPLEGFAIKSVHDGNTIWARSPRGVGVVNDTLYVLDVNSSLNDDNTYVFYPHLDLFDIGNGNYLGNRSVTSLFGTSRFTGTLNVLDDKIYISKLDGDTLRVHQVDKNGKSLQYFTMMKSYVGNYNFKFDGYRMYSVNYNKALYVTEIPSLIGDQYSAGLVCNSLDRNWVLSYKTKNSINPKISAKLINNESPRFKYMRGTAVLDTVKCANATLR